MPRGKYIKSKEQRKKISDTLSGRHVSPQTEWKKGHSPWIKGRGSITGENYKEYQRKYHNIYDKNKGREKYLIRQKAYALFRRNIINMRKVCENCNSDFNLELHHKEYINKPESVIILCRKCHKTFHK
jgi:hypothetical protein